MPDLPVEVKVEVNCNTGPLYSGPASLSAQDEAPGSMSPIIVTDS